MQNQSHWFQYQIDIKIFKKHMLRLSYRIVIATHQKMNLNKIKSRCVHHLLVNTNVDWSK
nr:MAG TPA: hypothetical protein [Caudoviricetes sp.]